QHKLHRAGIDDHVVHLHFTFVLTRYFPGGFEEDAGQRLEDVRLVHYGDFLAAVLYRVFKGEARNLLAGFARVDAGRDGNCAWIVADWNVVFVRYIEAADVFADQDDVDVFKAAWNNRPCRPD